MKRIVGIASLLMLGTLNACLLDEECVDEVMAVKVGDVYVDKYEASRSNATADTQGLGVTRACDYAHTMPWTSVSYEDAKNACLDAGKRLCTVEEWMAACGAGAYPYGDAYQAATCNDAENDEGAALATGSMSACHGTSGIFDMSGNVQEWVEGGYLMGGSYIYGKDKREDLRCNAALEVNVNTFTPTPSVGFRCCSDY